MSELDDAAKQVADMCHSLALGIMGDQSYAHTVWKVAKAYLPSGVARGGGRPPVDASVVEQGGAKWAARLLIFDHRLDLVADSQPDSGTDLNAQPRELLATLRHVGEWARAQATAFHSPTPITGLDDGALDRRISAARVTLSRANKAIVNWSLPYEVAGQKWSVMVRLAKATAEQAAAGPEETIQWRRPPLTAEQEAEIAARPQTPSAEEQFRQFAERH